MTLDVGLLVVRLTLGALLLYHGGNKLGFFGGRGVTGFAGGLEKMGIRPGYPFAVLAGGGQVLGAALLMLGLLGPAGAIVLASSMAVAVLVLLKNGFSMARGGYEYALVLTLSLLGISLTGPGRLSVDGWLGLAWPEPWTWLVFAILSGGGVAAAVLARQRRRETASEPARG